MPTMSLNERAAVVQTIPQEELDAAYAVLREILPGWRPEEDPDPLIDAPMFAHLAGVAPNTPGAWQQRTKEGKEKVPFPEPAEPKYRDKPQWGAISQALRYLMDSGRWPRGVVARENTRAGSGRERISFSDLTDVDRDLALALASLGANDNRPRTLQGWRSLRTRRATERGQQAA
jgi:hypothetical protein